ncbi:MAG: signal peptidase II [Actinobacteria bacterium]|nr:signal peptidase II [Actinomycetota bacterium]
METGRNDVVQWGPQHGPHRPPHGDDSRGDMVVALLVITFGTMAIDQLAKLWAISALRGGPVELPGPIELYLTANRGIAFSIGAGSRAIAAVVGLSCALLFLVLRTQWATATPRARLASGLLVGGAFGNLVDRVGRGAVVDFIHIRSFSVFNLADIAIVVAVGLLVIALLTDEEVRSGPRPA